VTDPPTETLGSALPPGTGVCVINLDARGDRWESFGRVMLPHLAPLPVDRISAVRGTALPGYGQPPYFRGRKRDTTWAARGGCTLSHRAALLHARQGGWSHVLVLEDDIMLHEPPSPDLVSALRDALMRTRFDICYLGHTDPVPPFRHLADVGGGHALHQVFGCNTAHAYLVSASAADRLLERLPQPPEIWQWLTRHRAVDRFYYRNLSPEMTVIALSPALIDQAAGFSDILGRQAPAYAECHRTAVPARHPGPAAYAAELARQAASFHSSGRIDALRGWWKRLNGF
jgi:hypothetical protein